MPFLDDSVSDQAKTYIRDTFAPGTNLAPLPEPAALSLIALPGAIFLRRRRGA